MLKTGTPTKQSGTSSSAYVFHMFNDNVTSRKLAVLRSDWISAILHKLGRPRPSPPFARRCGYASLG